MSFTAILAGIGVLLKNLPAILEVFKSLGEAAKDGVHLVTVQIELKKFDAAAATAKETKDTGALEDLFKPDASTRH